MSLPVRLLTLVCVLSFGASRVDAYPQFMKEFVNLYASDPDAEYTDFVKKEAKCYVCHQGKKKKNHNAYGDALEEYIGKPDRKDVEKIVAALKTVAEESSDPETEGAPTFGELIAQGKLPAGELEDLKAEPEE